MYVNVIQKKRRLKTFFPKVKKVLVDQNGKIIDQAYIILETYFSI